MNKSANDVDDMTTARHEQIRQIEAAASRADDIHRIRRLQRALGFFLDAGRWDSVLDLLSDDVAVSLAGAGIYSGRERVRDVLDWFTGGSVGLRQGLLHEFFMLQPVIHVSEDGNSARGRWRVLVMAGRFGEDAMWVEGTLETSYRRNDGAWRISALDWVESFAVDYEGGWAANRSRDIFGPLAREIRPDTPTDREARWPEAVEAPFHYDDPGVPFPAPGPAGTEDPGIRSMADRVERLRDAAEIENVVSAYGYYFDRRLWQELIRLFADDALVEYGQRGVYRGRPHIRRMLDLFGPEPIADGQLNNHIIAQPVIHVAADGRTAAARFRAIVQAGDFGIAGYWGEGVFEARFERHDGRWLIASLRYFPTFMSDYDKGFVDGAVATAGPSDSPPPDAPPSAAFESFPGVYVPPFHYAHPVTGLPIRDSRPGFPDPGTRDAKDLSLPAELESLDRLVTRLEDERDVEILQRSYGYLVDKALWREVSQLFATDGELEIGGRGVFIGPERVYEYMQYLGPEGPVHGRLINHLQLQTLVTVADDGRRANLRARFLAQGGDTRAAGDAPGVPTTTYLGTGVYENAYVKEDGTWKIASLHGIFRMYTRETEGWHKAAWPNTKVEENLPPDRPPTATIDMFPEIGAAPFHFPHPVTGETL